MCDRITHLLQLVQSNPTLKVYALVDNEAIDTSCNYTALNIGNSFIAKCAVFNDKVYTEDEEDSFKEDYYDENYTAIHSLCKNNYDIDEMLEQAVIRMYHKAIFVRVEE